MDGDIREDEVVMKDRKTPRNQEGQAPSKGGKDTAKRLEQKAGKQKGTTNRARTEDKARRMSSGR